MLNAERVTKFDVDAQRAPVPETDVDHLEARERTWRGRSEWEIRMEMERALERYRVRHNRRRSA